MLSVVTDDAAHSELAMSLDELAREGARGMLAAALEAEVDAYIAAHATLTDEHGHRLVRRNGHAPARQLATGAGRETGPVAIGSPRPTRWPPSRPSPARWPARSCIAPCCSATGPAGWSTCSGSLPGTSCWCCWRRAVRVSCCVGCGPLKLPIRGGGGGPGPKAATTRLLSTSFWTNARTTSPETTPRDALSARVHKQPYRREIRSL